MWFEVLLQEEITIDKQYYIFLKTIKFLREMENDFSYRQIIEEIFPIAEKNVVSFEKEKHFLKDEIQEYVQKYRIFWIEYLKYQIWLMGNIEDCKNVEKVLNFEKVHLLGRLTGGVTADGDYIIVCSNVKREELEKQKEEKIIRYDFLRYCAYEISPEKMYLDIKLRQKMELGIEGVVTGLSYEQRGINFDKIRKNFACLATPGQDLFLDYHNFLWAYKETSFKRKVEIKYCIVGMNFYKLWYDLSLSSNQDNMLCFYKRLKCAHHFHKMDLWLLKYEENLKVCEEIMVENYMDIDYNSNFHPELYYKEVNKQYEMSDEVYKRDGEEVKKVFHKPYPLTFEENVGILEMFLKFLYIHNIKTLVYIPPFPKIFNDFTPQNMKETTWEVLLKLKEKYEFHILDLSEDKAFENKHFADWSHLNINGANLATEILNNYMEEIWE